MGLISKMFAKPFNGRLEIDENDDGFYAILGSNGEPISDYFYGLEYLTENLARVYDDDKEKYAILNDNGNLISEWYSEIKPFKGSHFTAYDEDLEQYALLDSNGKLVSDWYESIDETKYSFAVVTNNDDRCALMDELGQIVSGWEEDEDDLKKVGTSSNVSVQENTGNQSSDSENLTTTSETKEDKQNPSTSSGPQITTSTAGYKMKELAELECSTESKNPEDFIEVLNTISSELGGVSNLGVFCDIKSIEQTCAVLSKVEEQFIHVETEKGEQPYDHLENDGSSAEPYDYDFDFLLNH